MTTSTHIDGTTPSPRPLHILIAGAGIGGLATALALRRQGHKTTVFEQSRFANEVGAAINIAPNCNGILRKLGLFLENHGAVDASEFVMMDQDGNIESTVDRRNDLQTYGHPYHLMHRAHLHKGLKDLAVSEEGDGTPCVLHTASRVRDVDAEKAMVALENGEVFSGDAVIGADGVHSRTRGKLPGASSINPFGSGMSGFRFLVSMTKLAANPLTSPLIREPGRLIRLASHSDNQSLVMYSCQNNEIMNCMLAVPTTVSGTDGESKHDWENTTSKDRMLASASPTYGAQARAVLDMAEAEDIRLWELMDMKTLPTWVVGRLAVLGDAAHPFTPWRGQGGAMAIEDAASLGALFPLGTTVEQIPQRLELYQECRRERAHAIQDMSRQASPLIAYKAARGVDEPKPDGDFLQYADYLLGYDEWKHSEEALAKAVATTATSAAP